MARARLFGSKVLRGIAAGAMLALSFGLHLPAAAQTTSGNASAGATLFNTNCNVGCHGATPLANFASTANAANAGGHIAWARANGMPAPLLTDAEYNNIAAYIAQSVPDPNPVGVSAPFNATAPGRKVRSSKSTFPKGTGCCGTSNATVSDTFDGVTCSP